MSDDFDGKVEEGSFVEHLSAIVCAIGEQVLDPGLAFAQCINDGLCAGAVGYVRGRDVHHQQPSTAIDRDVAIATHRRLGPVIAATAACGRCLDGLAAKNGGAGLARDRS